MFVEAGRLGDSAVGNINTTAEGKENGVSRTDVTALDISKTHTHVHMDCSSSRNIMEQRCLSEKCLLTLYSLTSTNNNKKHNHENHHNTRNSSKLSNSGFLSKERANDQVKAHKTQAIMSVFSLPFHH
ncbi:unnamed protein product [Leuciscus chuanchicus]